MIGRLSKLRFTAWVLSLTILICNPLWAEDVEIFFGRASNVDTQPNVLFILDASGSMNDYDCADPTKKPQSTPCSGDDSASANTTRLTRMKTALKDVLNNTTNINAGLMRFSHGYAGGRITYPIKPIDQQLCADDQPCDNERVFVARASVAASTDDATQLNDGAVDTDEAEIAVNSINGLPINNTHVGLRFPGLKIPQGAKIKEAKLSLTSTRDNDTLMAIEIRGEASPDANPYAEQYNNISARSPIGSVNWTASDWTDTGNYESPDISSLIQPIVNQAGWCGGNALGLFLKADGERYISSFDSGGANVPSLTVSYTLDDIDATAGCTQSTLLTRVTSPKDDATETYNSSTTTNSTVLAVENTNSCFWIWCWNTKKTSGIRFAQVNIPNGATIVNASLTLVTPNSVPGGSRPSIILGAQDSANPPAFESWAGDIRNRNISSTVSWGGIPATKNTEVTSPNLKEMVQELVTQGGWESGNSMVFTLEESGPGAHHFISFDGNPSKAPLLKIDFETKISSTSIQIDGPVTNVRSRIIEEIDAMVANGGTPTVGALLEAKNYFQGSQVDYGLDRAPLYNYPDAPWNRFDHPYGRYSRVSTKESYTGGGTVVRPSGCSDNALDATICATEHITGNPVYISPFSHECQSNHIVLLTDGEPNDDDDAVDKVEALTEKECNATHKEYGMCGEEIAEYLNTTDFDDLMPRQQNITVHTIGFNFANEWLKEVAKAGGGGFYQADSANQLSQALANIIDSTQDTNTSFVAPGATVDSFSRVSHRNDIYLALFKPKSTPGWIGNLKRFDFSGNPARLEDQNSNPAVNTTTGAFFDESQSYWSRSADGNEVSKGGAAHMLLQPDQRNLYTDRDSSKALSDPANKFSKDTIAPEEFGLDENDTAMRNKLVRWAQGYDVDAAEGDTENPRFHIGDPLHSEPVIVNYGGTAEEPDSVIYFGTNDGYLHAIQTSTGNEVFSFIPNELIRNLKPLYEGNPATSKIYGIDGSMSIVVKDGNNDGIISGTDKVMLYVGMRRGGNHYYALDISNKNSPELKWKISGGDQGFEELGQTWSKAVPTVINYQGTPTDVLIFGGGYDSGQDDKQIRHLEKRDGIGRAIYIVAADTKEILWRGQGPTEGQSGQTDDYMLFNDMIYSFPATPKVIDLFGDGQTDQIYIGDTGGRVWRFDINPNSTSMADRVTGGIVADLATDGIMSETRRFYHTPDISSSTIEGENYINIATGTGYQAHPLNTVIEDKFFLIRYPAEVTGNYGIETTTTTTTTDPETGVSSSDTSTEFSPITLADLFDATSNILGEGNPTEVYNAEQELAQSHGWFVNMEKSGEKILGSSVTFDNKILFTSYVPGTAAASGCSPEIGYGVFWALNLWDATPARAANDDSGTKLLKSDRTRDIPGGGLPAPVRTLFIESGNDPSGLDAKLQVLAISGPNNMMELGTKDLVNRVYWSEYPDF